MSGWIKGMSVHYGRNVGQRQFYWWCPVCEAYGMHERLSFVMTAGQQHRKVTHAA